MFLFRYTVFNFHYNSKKIFLTSCHQKSITGHLLFCNSCFTIVHRFLFFISLSFQYFLLNLGELQQCPHLRQKQPSRKITILNFLIKISGFSLNSCSVLFRYQKSFPNSGVPLTRILSILNYFGLQLITLVAYIKSPEIIKNKEFILCAILNLTKFIQVDHKVFDLAISLKLNFRL